MGSTSVCSGMRCRFDTPSLCDDSARQEYRGGVGKVLVRARFIEARGIEAVQRARFGRDVSKWRAWQGLRVQKALVGLWLLPAVRMSVAWPTQAP